MSRDAGDLVRRDFFEIARSGPICRRLEDRDPVVVGRQDLRGNGGTQFNAWEYLYYQNRDGSIPKELWVGADAFFKSLVETKPGLTRFWSEFEASFDEPFRTYVRQEFARRPTGTAG